MKKYISILFLFISIFATSFASGNPVTLSCFCSEVIEDPYACPTCPKEVVFTGLGITDDVTGDIKYIASTIDFQWKDNLFGSWVYINGVKYDASSVTIDGAIATLESVAGLDACIRGKGEGTPHNTLISTDETVSIVEGVNAEGGVEYDLSVPEENLPFDQTFITQYISGDTLYTVEGDYDIHSEIWVYHTTYVVNSFEVLGFQNDMTFGFYYVETKIDENGVEYMSIDSSVWNICDIVSKCMPPIAQIETTLFDPQTGQHELTPNFMKYDGSDALGEQYEIIISDCEGTLIGSFGGTEGTSDYIVTSGFDLTPYLTGSIADDTPFGIDTNQAALDSGFEDQNCEWTYDVFVTCNGLTSINSDNQDVTCNIKVVANDNQSWVISSDDGTTTIFEPNNVPIFWSGVDYGVIGNIKQAPSCAVVQRGTAPNQYYDIRHTDDHTLTMTNLVYCDGSVVNGNFVMANNTGCGATCGFWDYINEIGPAIVALDGTLNFVPINANGSLIPSGRAAQFASVETECGKPCLAEVWIEHSCDPSVPIILEYK